MAEVLFYLALRLFFWTSLEWRRGCRDVFCNLRHFCVPKETTQESVWHFQYPLFSCWESHHKDRSKTLSHGTIMSLLFHSPFYTFAIILWLLTWNREEKKGLSHTYSCGKAMSPDKAKVFLVQPHPAVLLRNRKSYSSSKNLSRWPGAKIEPQATDLPRWERVQRHCKIIFEEQIGSQ